MRSALLEGLEGHPGRPRQREYRSISFPRTFYSPSTCWEASILKTLTPSLIRTGKFVSESKFSSDPATFIPHILNKDRHALADLITKPAVERALLSRLGRKASIYGAEIGMDGEPIRVKKKDSPLIGRPRGLTINHSPLTDNEAKGLPKTAYNSPESSSALTMVEEDEELSWKIEVEEVQYLYEKWIIPLTKEVEVSVHWFKVACEEHDKLTYSFGTGGIPHSSVGRYEHPRDRRFAARRSGCHHVQFLRF